MANNVQRLDLPEEVMVKIITKLPVKSIMRFQCMSKSFKTLTTTQKYCISKHFSNSTKNEPKFIILHCIRKFHMTLVCKEHDDDDDDDDDEQQQPPSRQLIKKNDITPIFPFPCDSLDTIMAHGPVNGIFCLEVPASSQPGRLILWNPATREIRVVPDALSVDECNRENCTVVHGFGFDSETNDYKVVNISMSHQVEEEPQTEAYAQVYSLRTNSWKMINIDMAGVTSINNSMYTPLLNNNIYHWVIRYNGMIDSILCFDMRAEEFRTINLGPEVSQVGSIEEGMRVDSNVAIVKGLVTYIKECKIGLSPIATDIEIWTMREYGNEEYLTKTAVIGPNVGNWRFRGFWKDGDEVVLTGSLPGQMSFTLYNIDKQSMVKVIPVNVGLRLQLFKYVESIVPLSFPAEEE